MVYDLIQKCRSYRRFDAARPLDIETVRSFIASARYTPSGANLQKLRFAAFTDRESLDRIFPTLKFAGYLKEWAGPTPSERPTAYIVICSDSELNTLGAIDLGIAAEAIMLTAMEAGVGGCMLRSFNPSVISEVVGVEGMIPHMVLALGYPKEQVTVVDSVDGDIKYYRDADDTHVVPKLTLDTLIIN